MSKTEMSRQDIWWIEENMLRSRTFRRNVWCLSSNTKRSYETQEVLREKPYPSIVPVEQRIGLSKRIVYVD